MLTFRKTLPVPVARKKDAHRIKTEEQKFPKTMTSFTETSDHIQVMRMQEDTAYCKPSFSLSSDIDECEWTARAPLHAKDSYEKIVTWYIRVVDFCDFNREVAEIAASTLNSFLNTPQGVAARMDPSKYQLASLGALYITIKIHANKAMHPKSLAQLSGGRYTVSEIEQAESYILPALNWRVNPPTTEAFLRELIALLPLNVEEETRIAIFELAKMQYELLLPLPYFATTKASVIAFAALVNAIESLNLNEEDHLIAILSQVSGIHRNCTKTIEAQKELYKAVALEQPESPKRSRSPTSILQCRSQKSFCRHMSGESATPVSTMAMVE